MEENKEEEEEGEEEEEEKKHYSYKNLKIQYNKIPIKEINRQDKASIQEVLLILKLSQTTRIVFKIFFLFFLSILKINIQRKLLFIAL